jgi:hypothetical protein
VLQSSCSVRSVAAGGGKATNSCWWREKTAGEAYEFLPVAGEIGGKFSLRSGRVRGTPLEIRLVLRDVAGGSHMGHLPFSKCGTGNTWTQP